MNKLPLLLGGAVLLFSAVPQMQAADTDPGFTSSGAYSVYYRSALGAYGRDYTVTDGFVHSDKRKPAVAKVSALLRPPVVRSESDAGTSAAEADPPQ